MSRTLALQSIRAWPAKAPLLITMRDDTVWAGYKVGFTPDTVTIRAARDNGRVELLLGEIRSFERHPRMPLL